MTGVASFEQRGPRRPCHERAIHNSTDWSRADNQGQLRSSLDLRRSSFLQVTAAPDLALGAGGRLVQATIASPDRTYTLYVLVDCDGVAGLVRLAGTDPTVPTRDEG
jgi:hypothetical protein